MSYEIVLCDSFKKAVKHLKKRHRNIAEDIKQAGYHLQKHPDAGDVIPGGKGIRKLRVQNSDMPKGARGSYRLLYYVQDTPNNTLYFLFIYAKNQRNNISRRELLELLQKAGLA